MPDITDPGRIRFAKAIKPILPELESGLGEFSTYLLETVAACKQSGSSDLFTREEATEIMAYVQGLSNMTGGRDTRKGTPDNIMEAVPEIYELLGVLHLIKTAMRDERKVDKDTVKRFFELSARTMNYMTFTINDTGV